MPPIKPTTSQLPGDPSKEGIKFMPCPRPNFETGHDDWYTLPPPSHDVDVCPTCYDATFKDTSFGGCFSKATPKPEGMATRCDLADRWNRAATCMIFSQHAPHLGLLARVATLPGERDGDCPNLSKGHPVAVKGGKPAVSRTWYCLYDPIYGTLIEDLTVCSSCISRFKIIFPRLGDIFKPVSGGEHVQGTCDLLTAQNEHDGRRGEQYLDIFFEAEKKARETCIVDVRPIMYHVRKWARIPVCVQGDNIPQGATSYTFPLSMPNYAACEECYQNHILPHLNAVSPPPILKELRATKSPNGFVCDLYSPRLQQWFNDACTSGDLGMYSRRIRMREEKMQEYSRKLRELDLQHQQYERQAHLYAMQMESARGMEAVRALQFSTTNRYPVAPPVSASFS